MRPNHRNSPSHRADLDASTLDCAHFGDCGGCSRLDQPIRWQLREKIERCEALLAPHLGGKRIRYRDPRRNPRAFRTRLLYPVQTDSDKLPYTGLFAYKSNHLVHLDECQTMDRWLFALGQAMETVLRDLRLAAYRVRSGKGFVKAVWARLASGTGEVLAGVVTRPGVFEQGREFADRLFDATRLMPSGRASRKLAGVVHSISDREDDFLLGDRHTPLRGRDHIVDRRDELTFRISAGSFYQIHAGAFDLLYHEAVAMCGDVRGKRVIDGYGGVGAFGLRLARAGASQVTVVEDNDSACRDAEHNIKANALSNIDVERAPFAKAKFAPEPHLMVVDPPRSGLHDAGVRRVLAARPQKLLHVACDAASLAQDLAGLTAGGYEVQEVRLCDLFPHTEHVELAALLHRS